MLSKILIPCTPGYMNNNVSELSKNNFRPYYKAIQKELNTFQKTIALPPPSFYQGTKYNNIPWSRAIEAAQFNITNSQTWYAHQCCKNVQCGGTSVFGSQEYIEMKSYATAQCEFIQQFTHSYWKKPYRSVIKCPRGFLHMLQHHSMEHIM